MNNNITVDSNLAYEVAKSTILEKEQKILELTIMYNQALQEIEILKRQLQQLNNQGE